MTEDGSVELPAHLSSIDYLAPGFADHWDELPLWSAPFGQAILDQVPLAPSLVYLDVGAGTGWLTLELAQRAGPGSTVVAVDPWVDALRRLEAKARRLGLSNVTTHAVGITEASLAPESVDVVVSCLGVNNFEDAAAALAACARAARPGATLLLATNPVGHMREFYDALEATLIAEGCADRLSALEAHVRHRGDEASVRELLEGAGFRVEAARHGEFRWRFSGGAALLRHGFIRLGFLPAWRAIVPEERLATVFGALERRLDAEAKRTGSLDLTIPVLCMRALR